MVGLGIELPILSGAGDMLRAVSQAATPLRSKDDSPMADRSTASARRATPSDPQLLGLFCRLVEEYDHLGAAFPVSVASFELMPENPADDTERWHRIVRAMALRKFVLGQHDYVRADKVLVAFRNCLSLDPPMGAGAVIA